MNSNVIFLKREKALLDTSVYISYLYRGLHGTQMEQAIRAYFLYLHSTVFEELLAGSKTKKEKKELAQLKNNFIQANRVITPSDEDWEETGELISQLFSKSSLPSHKMVSLTHDILIALSSRKQGIRVITENKKDFELIRQQKNFKLTVWNPDQKLT